MPETQQNSEAAHQQQVDRVVIEYYTDPLCCWSWAFEPEWRRLRYEFEGKIEWQYRMGGLLPNWSKFSDPFNSVDRPLQMGPVWMEAQQRSGQPMADHIWVEDPPTSSYPACIAVKCAQLQSAAAGEQLLRHLREAVMLEGKNIADQEVILRQAQKLNQSSPAALDLEQFKEDISSGKGQQSFVEDLQKMRYHNFSRFPTLTFSRPGKQAIMITGYRPYSVLLDAFKQVAPDLSAVQTATSAEEYQKYWGSTTAREVDEALGKKLEKGTLGTSFS